MYITVFHLCGRILQLLRVFEDDVHVCRIDAFGVDACTLLGSHLLVNAQEVIHDTVGIEGKGCPVGQATFPESETLECVQQHTFILTEYLRVVFHCLEEV